MITSPHVTLITGGNKGIGFAVARKLGLAGHTVWLGSRDLERGDDAAKQLRGAGVDARAVQLDVTDQASVTDAAAIVTREAGKLNVLINNAGIMFRRSRFVAEETIDEVKQTFETNVFGTLRVTQAFLPLLRKSQPAQIIMMSSGLGSFHDALDFESNIGNVGFGGYRASKAALNMLTIKLARELDDDGIRVNAVDPGFTSTDMTGNDRGHSAEEGARPAVELATKDAFGSSAGFYALSATGDLISREW